MIDITNKKKTIQVLDNPYLKGVNFHKNTKPMHDLKTNFDKILSIVKKTLADQLNKGVNLQAYPTSRFRCHLTTTFK